MKNSKFSVICDAVLCFLLCFILTLIFLSALTNIAYFLKLFIAFSFSFCFFLIIIKLKIEKFSKNQISFSEEKTAKKLLLKLEITPDNEVIEALFEILVKKGITCKKSKNHIESAKSVYLFNFDKQTSRAKICAFLRAFCNKKLYLFCNKVSEDCLVVLNNFKHKLTVIEAREVYTLFKESNSPFLTSDEFKEKTSAKITAFLLKVFTKKRAISFTLISGSLLLFSNFTFFPFYYKLCALFSAILAIICLVFGKRDSANKSNGLTFDN